MELAISIVALVLSLVSLGVSIFRRISLSPTEAALRGFAYAEQWGVNEAKLGRKVGAGDKRKMALDAAKRLAPKAKFDALHTALEAEIRRSKKTE